LTAGRPLGAPRRTQMVFDSRGKRGTSFYGLLDAYAQARACVARVALGFSERVTLRNLLTSWPIGQSPGWANLLSRPITSAQCEVFGLKFFKSAVFIILKGMPNIFDV